MTIQAEQNAGGSFFGAYPYLWRSRRLLAACLLNKIQQREATVGIIGLGYVGLPLVIAFCRAGFKVTGFDCDQSKVEMLVKGESYIRHIELPDFCEACNFTTDFSLLQQMDCMLICVPTPLNANRDPDMSFVFDTTRTIAAYLRSGQLICLESTTYPGTTDVDMRMILEKTGLAAGADFFLAYSPEREDPTNKQFSLHTVPKVVGGFTPECLAVAKALYDAVVDTTVSVSSCRVAESSKLLENIYRSVNIALVNELKMLFDKMGIDIWEVIEAAKTKPFGFQAFYPGPGLGGHCIPIDPFYLTWKAKEYNFHTEFIELAGKINTSMPDYVVSKAMIALNNVEKPIKGAKVLILGLAYKGNVDDFRESPSFRIIEKLEEFGALVSYNDPFIPVIGVTREFHHLTGRTSVEISNDFDLLLIATAHDSYNAIDFSSFGVPVLDTRHIVKNPFPLLSRA